MYLIIALLVVQYAAAQGLFNLITNECDFYQELYESGFNQTPATGQFEWISDVTAPVTAPGAPDNPCRRQGVLRVKPTAANNQIRVRFGLYDVTAWSLNVGDSSTNNGYAWDSSTSSWEAEVQNFHKQMIIYENMINGNGAPVPECDFYQELYESGFNQTPATGQFQWISDVTAPVTAPGAPDNPCRRQRVLRVTPTAANNRIRVRFGLYDVTAWSLNVGDSSTNNGWGGDSSTSSWEAEVHNFHKQMTIYENIINGNGAPVPGNYLPGYFETCPVVWDMNITRNKFPNLENPTDLAMTTDPYIKGTEYRATHSRMYRFDDIFIGINRVIYGPGDRVGLGACVLCVNLN